MDVCDSCHVIVTFHDTPATQPPSSLTLRHLHSQVLQRDLGSRNRDVTLGIFAVQHGGLCCMPTGGCSLWPDLLRRQQPVTGACRSADTGNPAGACTCLRESKQGSGRHTRHTGLAVKCKGDRQGCRPGLQTPQCRTRSDELSAYRSSWMGPSCGQHSREQQQLHGLSDDLLVA
jgi:hypothetical protein